ncbi:hypothetical protein [Dyella sp. 2RAB6]|uniref:hypothetical protein n=1 Tax=Dyella sp. 2RAB6 TaxID=3232992 RepID=UPI003F903FCD
METAFLGVQSSPEANPTWIYPDTQLDRLLNDLQGNTLLMLEDEGLARLVPERLQTIRADALAQAAAAWTAAVALRRFVREWASEGWLGTPDGGQLRSHLAQLRQDAQRWRQLAEYAGRYLAHPQLARLHARNWFDQSRISGEYPGRVTVASPLAGASSR